MPWHLQEDSKKNIYYLICRLGGSDGNGGVEAHGHNPDDYKLPEKYTYGAGEEYNF